MSKNRKADFRRQRARYRAKARAQAAPDCPTCGKRLYPTQAHAIEAIATLDAGGRVYECSGGWHTTSQQHRDHRSAGS